ncbi:MAG: maleylpyruvate isomerase family mycothiol-dependent enzyme [Nocardioidaceae bacterium]|nr:maleylpyruvate isomerase family mycothiol-dependent enzyme [Nocardioidaceae bacterium]NUS50294.1 maleylpyruvate isomerase family mycothiol-dependent enzyme [Nocardioidaceae bacterium]
MNAVTRPSTAVDFVEEYAAAAERFAVAVAWADPRALVPSCAGWTVSDLVVHLGNVHAWAATIVETGLPAVEQNDHPRGSRSRTASQWYAGKAEDLYEVLRHADPEQPCWNFAFGTGVAGFWQRRQLHETTVHGFDLDLATDRETAETDPVVAADGVDEVLTVFLHRMSQRGHVPELERPVLVSASDTGDAWLVSPQPRREPPPLVPEQPSGPVEAASPRAPTVVRGRPALERSGAAVEALSAPADVLYRLLWKRLPLEESGLVVEGDDARVRAFLGSRLVP